MNELTPLRDLETEILELRRKVRMLEKERTDVVMAASIKLASARMVLMQLVNGGGLTPRVQMGLQGVLDALPKAPPRLTNGSQALLPRD